MQSASDANERNMAAPAQSGEIVIHVEYGEFINHARPFSEWLLQARPLPWEMEKVKAILRGEIPAWKVTVLPRVSRIRKLMVRAVRAHMAGDRQRAEKLVACAKDQDWHDCGINTWDLLRGLEHDLIAFDSRPRKNWLAQADWWAGGKWNGGAASDAYWAGITQAVVAQLRQDHQFAASLNGVNAEKYLISTREEAEPEGGVLCG
jgi:hypothetical protein